MSSNQPAVYKARRLKKSSKVGILQVIKEYPSVIIYPAIWLVIGIIEVFSASRFRAEQLRGDPTYFLKLDLVWRTLGVISFLVAYAFFTKKSRKGLFNLLFLINLGLLGAVLLTSPVNGAKRWFSLGPINLHPTEFLKFSLIGMLAYRLISLKKYKCRSYQDHIKQHLIPFLKTVLLPVGLIILQPDLSGAGLVLLVALLLYVYMLGENFAYKDILWATVLGSALVLLLILVTPYRLQRFKVFTNLLLHGEVVDIFGSGNQIYHILIGISRGGIWGVGLGQSRQQAGYLVETTAFTDSIAAVIFEEFGFIISTLIMFSYLLWYLGLAKLLTKLNIPEAEKGIVWGYINLILIQAFIHFAVNLGILPFTGIPLPFISYGGSALAFNMAMLGVIVRILSEAYDRF